VAVEVHRRREDRRRALRPRAGRDRGRAVRLARLVVPQTQRSHPTRWSSHKDHATKALKKLAGPHLPASLKEFERAINRAHRERDTAVQRVEIESASRAADAGDVEGQVDADQDAGVHEDASECDIDEALQGESA
jgi:hypothetical protein